MSEGKSQIAKRAGIVGSLTFLSRIGGLIRDMSVAHVFGTGAATDAFLVGFRIPNLLRRLLAEGALTVSVVPVFTQAKKESEAEAQKVIDVTFSSMIVLMTIVSILGMFLSPLLVRLIASGFVHDSEKLAMTIKLTRVMFPYIFLVSLAAWAMGILNSIKHFSSPALAPVLMNVGIILGALFFSRYFNPPVMGLAVGVLFGGVMQLIIHFPPLWKAGYKTRWRWNPKHPSVKKIVAMMIPAAYGAAVYQFNVLVITQLASRLSEGSVSYLWFSDRVMEFPLGIFAVSLATVILPTLSDHAANNNIEALKEDFRFGLRLILFITLPAALGMILLAQPIVSVLFQHGHFDQFAAHETMTALIFFAIGLPFISGVRITSNAFYALQDSKTPMRVANLSVLVNLILSVILMYPMKHNGLALAISLSSFFNFAMHVYDFQKKVGDLHLSKIFQSVTKILFASFLMGFGIFFTKRYFPFPEHAEHAMRINILYLALYILGGATLYVLLAFLFRIEEMDRLWGFMKKKLPKQA